jgi:ubiquinone/menaquinone biosynthesis C-methylase UbiE
MAQSQAPTEPLNNLDTETHEDFFKYYAQQSLTPQALARFRNTAEILLRLLAADGRQGPFDVVDIGCGAGAQAQIWLEQGHRYAGIDINRPLIELAAQRARERGLAARFEVGTATTLPLADASQDISLLPFILEHVQDWQACVDEALRVLRPGGYVFIGTTNKLCPSQDEYRLPVYSWYPAPLKRHYERRAVTDWPAVANHAKYPAVHWFSPYQLGRYLRRDCDTVLDRFDLIRSEGRGTAARAALRLIQALPPARFAGHVLTPYTVVVGRKAA